MKEIILLTKKDLKIQFRSFQMIIQMIFFGLLIVFVFNIAFSSRINRPEALASSTIWVALGFVSIINLNRSFMIEREGDSLQAVQLTGVKNEKIFLSKFLSSLVIFFISALIIIPAALVLFNVIRVRFFWPMILMVIFGAVGFGAVGIILASMNSSTNYNENFLSIILFPLILPVIGFSINATTILLEKGTIMPVLLLVVYLFLYDSTFLLISYYFFDQIIED